MATTLTIKGIEKLKKSPPKKRVVKSDGATDGLFLIVQPSGAMSWAVWYRGDNGQAKFTLGKYAKEVIGSDHKTVDDVIGRAPALTLSEARRLATEVREAASAGRDPAKERKAARKLRVQDAADTSSLIENVWENYVAFKTSPARSKPWKPRYKKEAQRLFENEVKPYWGGRRIQDITRDDVIDLLSDIAKRQEKAGERGTTANGVYASVVSPLFARASDGLRPMIDASPCPSKDALVHAGILVESVERDRVLSEDEIRWFWSACENLGWPFGPFYQLLLLTGQRRDEVAGMTEAELDLEGRTWTLPGTRTKNSRSHLVHLSDLALDVIASITKVRNEAGYLFCMNGKTHISGYSRAKARLDALMLAEARKEAENQGDDPEKVAIKPWVPHDLRRTMITYMNEKLAIDPHVVDAAANHISGTAKAGVAGTYNRAAYLDKRRRAFDAWGRYLEDLTGNAPENIVQFVGGQA